MSRWFCALVAFLPLLVSGATETPRILTGEIRGAKWTAVIPAGWTGNLWIEAHGLREESTPLIADLHPRAAMPRALLERGWAAATTSYRRNGLVVADAMDDLIALRAHLATVIGVPKLTIVEGSSMGGAIVTRLAERGLPEFDAFVAAGAALLVNDPRAKEPAFTWQPKRPVLFLTNRSELEVPETYVAKTRATDAEAPVALWRVDRDGHVNLNSTERIAALEAAARWAQTRTSPGDRADATAKPEPGPSTVTRNPDGTLTARVIELSRVYGNITTDLQPADLKSIGVALGGHFILHTEKGAFDVTFGTSYADVSRGQWVAFTTGEGQIMIARNFANAAERAELDLGYTFRVEAVKR